ncbi:MAG: alpha-2-macroglobulin family protein [Thiothrix sp.]|nr:MAG: alpha-2-macroglobulin family protein [Thiothrix sp.]
MGLRQLSIWQSALISFWFLFSTPYLVAQELSTLKPATYTNQQLLSEMLVVDAAEQTLDKAPALVVTFSQDLDANQDPAEFFTITQGGKAVEGKWAIINSPRRLYFTQIQADTSYRIQIRPGVIAKNGLKLLKPVDFEIKTRVIQPAFDFASKGSLIPQQLADSLPIRVVNVPELDVEFLRVQPEKLAEVFKAIRLDGSLQSWELEEVHQFTTSVYTMRYPTNAKPNARETFKLPINQIEALKQPGLYFAVIRQPGRFTDKAYRINHFIVSNIGLQARVYAKTLEVFAHGLDSGKPLRGIKIAVTDRQNTTEIVTDENGRANFAKRPSGDFFITAASADHQFAFLDLRSPPLDLSSFPIEGLPEKPIDPYIYASQALYRPGDTLNLNILQRDQDGLVATHDLKLSIVRPDTKVIWEQKLTPTDAELGYYLQRFSLDDDAPEGTWRAELRLDDDPKLVSVFEFKVEQYKPEYFNISLSGGKVLLTRDDQQVLSVQGSYAHGAAAAKQTIAATRSLELDLQPLGSAFKDYRFGVPEDVQRLTSSQLPERRLDEQGNGFLEFPAVDPAIQSPLKTRVTARLLELGSRPISSELQQVYWPTQHLVGIKPLFANASVAANSEAHFELARVDPTGTLVAAQNLTATLFSESYDYYWEYDQDKGWQRHGIRNQYPVSQQQIEIPAGQTGQVSLAVTSGQYRLELEDADTKLKAAYVFTAGWSTAVSTQRQPKSLDLKLDKAVYKSGETAQLTVNLPAASEVLLTVEGGKLLWSQQMSLPAGTSFLEVSIDTAWQQHDLYIAVQALQMASAQPANKPERLLGIVPLVLDRSERQVELSLEAPDRVMAEQSVKVTVSAKHLKSSNTLVTLSAVDARVLQYLPLKKPSPFDFYFSPHAYETRLYDAYDEIITDQELNASPPAKQPVVKEANSALAPKLPRRLLVLEAEPVKFDAEGQAEITLNLPALTGDLHLTATVIGTEQLGSISKTIQVGAPVQLNLAAPAFLAAGDQASLKFSVKNLDESDQLIRLKLKTNSLLTGADLEQELTLSKGQVEQLQLPITALGSVGLGELTLELIAKDFRFKRELKIPIRPSYRSTVSYQQQELLGTGNSFDLTQAVSKEYLANTAETCLSISDTPSLPVGAVLRSLLNYPYDSLEQTVSSTYPYLFLDDAALKKWSLPSLSLAQRTQQVQKALIRLRSMQLPNGGFSAWARMGAEEYWLNAYVSSFLLDARQQGFTVPDTMLDAALSHLQETWKQETSQLEERYPFTENVVQMDLAMRAYAAYVLAREHRLTLNDLKSFADKHGAQMEFGLSLVNLGLALNLQGDATRGEEYIQRGLSLSRDPEVYLGDYGTSLRDRAMLLYHLLLAKQTVPALSVHLNYILRDLAAHTYLSTQEQVYIFLLGQLIEQQAKAPWKAQLVLDGQTIDLAQTGSFTQCVAEFKGDSKLLTINDEAIYFNLLTQAYPKQSLAATDNPLRIQRKWYDLAGRALKPEDLKVGDLVLTRLNIESSETIPHALVVDLLPSGFEFEPNDLQANEVLQGLKLEDMAVSVAETMAYSAAVHEEFWQDRYIANLALKAKSPRTLFYLVRVAQAGQVAIPQAYISDLDRPFIQGLSAGTESLNTKP